MPQPVQRPISTAAGNAPGASPRRAGEDRRQRPTPMVSRYTLFGRRRRNRRDTDPGSHYYVDWIEGPYLRALVWVCIFIVLDSLSTLYIISRGGSEANPLMRWILERGTFVFLASKLATAIVGFFLLAVHRFFPIARALVILLLSAYGILVLYHMLLLSRIHL
jgi:hypothetical protein